MVGEELPPLPPLTARHWFFIIQIFEQLSCPEKQLPWNFSLCWNIFYLSGLLRNLCLPWKTVCPESTVLIYIFNHPDFWTTYPCPEKQSLPRNFSLHWNIFYLSGFLSKFCLPWKTECALNSLYWICHFYHSEFWTICACPEKQSCPEIFHCIQYSFYIQDFWATCACPEKQNLTWNFSLYSNIVYISGFLSNVSLPWKQSLPENFQAGGDGRPPAAPPRTPLWIKSAPVGYRYVQVWIIAKRWTRRPFGWLLEILQKNWSFDQEQKREFWTWFCMCGCGSGFPFGYGQP